MLSDGAPLKRGMWKNTHFPQHLPTCPANASRPRSRVRGISALPEAPRRWCLHRDFQGVNLEMEPAEFTPQTCRRAFPAFPNDTDLRFTPSSRYGSDRRGRRRWHKIRTRDNMGGKSSDIFYCPLLNRVMVFLNCAEWNGAILRSALKLCGCSPSQSRETRESFFCCFSAALTG